MATDTWTQAKAAMVGIWRRVRPERVSVVEEDLDELRQEVLTAREQDDTAAQNALAADWQQQLARLLRQDPDLADELQRVLDDVLAPSLRQDEREGIYQQINIARDHGRAFGVQGGNLIYHEGKPSGEVRPHSPS
ncbi:hypothetical protein PV733_39970 [Streptomyces europaeiscabiei]|uniref:hypothetical protein n=1 Tax=Streptomyces europaeiscabiei TaxID=146819 RepID=UPI0029B25741|nr:hypothetical protein [Streptomyces europaeiscabiei]MDX3714998.1 hypothetical protein [Streptomyces europaeiscabiei]